MAETLGEINTRLGPARAAIVSAIAEHESSIGPSSDPDLVEQWTVDADESADIPGAMLVSEWVMVVAWVDVDSGLSWTTRLRSENMPEHHMVGLLTQALD